MSPRSLGSGALFLSLALVAGGCASWGALGGGEPSQSRLEAEEIAELKKHIVELERRAAMVEVEVSRLRKRLAELENDTGARSPAMPKAEDAMTEPVARVVLPMPDPGQGVESTDLPRQPDAAIASPPVVEPGAKPDGAAPPGGDSLSASAQALYDRGYTLFHQGRYLDSETAFQQFLQRFGSTVLGDNAQFWIAEARYARGDVDGALAAFRETVLRFPNGNKVPDAGLKIGDCLRDLGDSQGARLSYRKVIENHPNSAASAIAEERLAGTGDS